MICVIRCSSIGNQSGKSILQILNTCTVSGGFIQKRLSLIIRTFSTCIISSDGTQSRCISNRSVEVRNCGLNIICTGRRAIKQGIECSNCIHNILLIVHTSCLRCCNRGVSILCDGSNCVNCCTSTRNVCRCLCAIASCCNGTGKVVNCCLDNRCNSTIRIFGICRVSLPSGNCVITRCFIRK